ncbi:MAG: hypothetical protein AB1725_12425 [Armatimonadota bacterium]
MEVAEWSEVDRAFDRLRRHPPLEPTLVAMGKLVALIRGDAAFAGVRPVVSMASLLLSRGHAKRRVCVEWDEKCGYRVHFVDPPLELTEPTTVGEDAVVQVLRDYLDRLSKPP